MTLFPAVKEIMDKNGLEHVLLSGGGIIPEDDAAELTRLGVGRLFGPGAPMQDIVTYFRSELPQWRSRRLAN